MIATRKDRTPITCDRPLCVRHRFIMSRYIACTRGKNKGCRAGSVDYCPQHAKDKGYL